MDDELIERAKRGDREAMKALYERHAGRVLALSRRLSGDGLLAEDCAQEAWLRVFRSLPAFRGDSRFTTWLHRIAINTALSLHRGQRRRLERSHELAQGAGEEGRQEKPLLRLRLERALAELPSGMRRVLVLHDVEGYTHEEIAGMLGVAVGTSKSQLFKARARMRALLEPAGVRREGEEICSI